MHLNDLLRHLNEGFTFFVIFPAIVLLGLYFSIKLRFVQFSKLGLSIRLLLGTKHKEGDGITHYQAVAAVLAGNFGTGNISGMAVALTTGGPGALVWMWIIAFLGAGIQYASCILGIKYRQKNSKQEYVGGPMYYLQKGLNFKRLASIFAIFAILGSLTVGNFTQVNSIVLPLEKVGIPPLLSGIIIAILVGVVLLGGMQRFAKMASSVVPIMALMYFGTALVILGIHIDQLIPALKQMFQAAIAPSSFLGGALGYGFVKTVTTGFDRGIFATDAGTGIVPILQSSTDSDHPVINGIVTLIAPVLVMLVCTTTGLVLMVTEVWQSGLESTNMVTAAFVKGLGNAPLGEMIVIVALFLFSYTTVLAWACCGERAIGFLFGEKWPKKFRIFFIATIPLGAFFDVNSVWLLADISISLMLATNMIGVARLSKEVLEASREYFTEKPAVLSADDS